jgi:hypothetical protein
MNARMSPIIRCTFDFVGRWTDNPAPPSRKSAAIHSERDNNVASAVGEIGRSIVLAIVTVYILALYLFSKARRRKRLNSAAPA